MTKVKTCIELEPSAHACSLTIPGFICPNCSGIGHHVEQSGKDEYQEKLCGMCKGAGRLKAYVEIAYVPDVSHS